MYCKKVLYNMFFDYLCRVFFIVLELRLRLMKIGCREAINFFLSHSFPKNRPPNLKTFLKDVLLARLFALIPKILCTFVVCNE